VHGEASAQANSPKETLTEVYAKDRSAEALSSHDGEATTAR